MRILANEDVSGTVIRELRARGHDVVAVKEVLRGQSDEVILARARQESRLLITHDTDFGELAVRWGLPAGSGVVLLRLGGADPDQDNRRILEVLSSRDDWGGHIAIVTRDRLRLRPLPAPGHTGT